MGDPLARSARQVAIADHLWEQFNHMSGDMGVDRDGLINQALFAFAKQHGYVPQRNATQAAEAPVAAAAAPTPQAAPPVATQQAATAAASPRVSQASMPPQRPTLSGSKAALGVSAPRVATAAPAPVAAVPAPVAAPVSDPLGEDSVGQNTPGPGAGAPAAANEATPGPPVMNGTSDGPSGKGILALYAEGRQVDRVTGARFLIGRGKHCDLIINSGKVSREHAAIIKEGESYFIEDLGSSNGTWYDKKRISRRKIGDGDEYFVCSEKITCRFE